MCHHHYIDFYYSGKWGLLFIFYRGDRFNTVITVVFIYPRVHQWNCTRTTVSSNTALLCNVHYKVLTRFTSAKLWDKIGQTTMKKLSSPWVSQTIQQNECSIEFLMSWSRIVWGREEEEEVERPCKKWAHTVFADMFVFALLAVKHSKCQYLVNA